MEFNRHDKFTGKHALLGASKYHWLNYDSDKLAEYYRNQLAVQRGTELHDLAAKLIHHGVKLTRSKKTLNMYVNDAIGYKMTPEQVLYWSDNCFGTADAISFRNGTLRIHDLKTGATPAHMEQLMIYAALFCLEYGVDPAKIDMELRIYQSDEVVCHSPEPEEIAAIEDKIVEFDKELDLLKKREA